MTGVMAHTLIGCVLVILAASSWSVGSNLPTSTASCNQKKGLDQRKCFLTADCPICATSQVRCFDGALLKPFYERRFDDEFCGQHGIVLVQLNSTVSPYLAPLECRHGMCPFSSQCLIGPFDGRPYCCSTGPTDAKNSIAKNWTLGENTTDRANLTDHATGQTTEAAGRKLNTGTRQHVTTEAEETVSEYIVVDTFPTEADFTDESFPDLRHTKKGNVEKHDTASLGDGGTTGLNSIIEFSRTANYIDAPSRESKSSSSQVEFTSVNAITSNREDRSSASHD